MAWTSALPYFPEHELACQGTGVIKLDLRFAVALPVLRHEWGRPLTPSSVCRTPEHNTNERGHKHSLHLTENPKWPTDGTMAADIIWSEWDKGMKLAFARLAWRLGWSVGLHNTFCHIDRRADLRIPGLSKAVFLYGSWSGVFTPDDVAGWV